MSSSAPRHGWAHSPPLQAELGRARARIARLERSMAEAGDALRRLEAELVRQRPWYRAAAHALRRGWLSLASFRASPGAG